MRLDNRSWKCHPQACLVRASHRDICRGWGRVKQHPIPPTLGRSVEKHRYRGHAPAGLPADFSVGSPGGQLFHHPHTLLPSSDTWARCVGCPDGKCQLPLPDAVSALEVARDSPGCPWGPLLVLSSTFHCLFFLPEDRRPKSRQEDRSYPDCLARSQDCVRSALTSVSV